MGSIFFLAVGAALTGRLAKKLSGDVNAGLISAAAYGLAPTVRRLADSDIRLAAALAMLPGFLLIFYRALELPHDAGEKTRRSHWFVVAACLFIFGYLDPRFATVAGLLVWGIVLTGLAMDGRRQWRIWGPLLKNWSLACIGAVILYAPLWLWRRSDPTPLPAAAFIGRDFLDLLRYSPAYLGIAAALLAAYGATFSRSYLGQARLWSILGGLFFWAALGPRFFFNGSYLWWVPALGRGFQSLPWLGSVPPQYFGAIGHCALAIGSAYGLTALYASMPLKFLRWPWLRPAVGIALTGVVVADYLIP